MDLRHSITAVDESAAAIARGHGLHPVRHYWHMQIDFAGPPERSTDPDGIDIRTVDPERDLPAVHAILEAAFADDPSDHPEPFDRWVEELTADPSYDPTLWLLAREAGVPVGVLTSRAGDDGGWVEWLAILATYRGRGIGSALLHRTFRALAARGQRRVMLTVNAENLTGATVVYERAGMRVVNRWDLWERVGAVPAAGAGSSDQPVTPSRGDQR